MKQKVDSGESFFPRSGGCGVPVGEGLGQSGATAGCWSKARFSAALISGGRSLRMGRDKAQIAVGWEGETVPLRVRQLRMLQRLEPKELFYSGPAKPGDLPLARVIADEWPDAGPLSGIASCLQATSSELLLCLAVDLARMDALFLMKILTRCRGGRGVVPRIGENYEPLVAVYPKASLAIAIEQLQSQRLPLQEFARRLLNERLIGEYQVLAEEIPLFVNWNTPEDVDS